MRLIDADMFVEEAKPLTGVPIERIKNAPTIDPETLPIVRELREQLAKVTAERDAAMRGEKV